MSDTVLFTSEDNDIANQSVDMLFFISGKKSFDQSAGIARWNKRRCYMKELKKNGKD